MRSSAFRIDLNGTVSQAVQVPAGRRLRAISSLGQFTGATFGMQISFDNGVSWLTVNAIGSATPLAVGIDAAAGCYIPLAQELFMVPVDNYQTLIRLTCTAQAAERSMLMHFL